MRKIRIGIYGYGNLGKGVELALQQNPDMELVGVFTRRAPESLRLLTPNAKAYAAEDAERMRGDIDVMILCGGSATDLPVQGPKLAAMFNTIDSFDTHAKIPQYFEAMDAVAKAHDHVSILSVGWDPGLFSLNRLYAGCVLPEGKDYTFWGSGVSQGHSDAIRRIEGVADAKQYTVPVDEAVEAVRSGSNPELTTREKHTRVCYVVLKDGADAAAVEREIVTMPNYFADYDTTVHFVDQETLNREHGGLPHGGFVIRTGKTGANGCHNQRIEYALKLDSNPEFTASVLVCYARAAYKMAKENLFGAKTVIDVPPAYLSARTGAELRKMLL